MLIEKKYLYALAAVATISWLIGCGGKGEARPEKKEAAKAEKDHQDRIVLSPEAMKNADIKVVSVKMEPVSEKINATANIAQNQDRTFHVTPRIRGRVVDVYVTAGNEVRVGTPLALLDSTELGEVKAEYAKARTLLELARANAEREKRLFEQKIAAQKDLLAAQAEERRAEAEVRALHEKLRLYGLSEEEIDSLDPSPSQYRLTSPGTGVVIEKDITKGEVIETGKKVFTISDLSTVWVLLNIYEKDLAKITRGTPVKIRTESYPGEIFSGKVAYVGDTLDPQSRTLSVRVEVPNPRRRLKPGMFATAEMAGGATSKQSILAPSSAIQKIDGRPAAFVQQKDGSFVKRDLELGKEVSGKVEVKSGLTEGEQLVIEGSFTLKSELLKETLAED